MNIKETIAEIRNKYSVIANQEINAAFNCHYSKLFCVNNVSKTVNSITIEDCCVHHIQIDNYNNLNCDFNKFFPVKYLPYFRILLNDFFDNPKHSYYLRCGTHLFMEFFRKFRDSIDDDYLYYMLNMDDSMAQEKHGFSFRKWLFDGNLSYPRPKLLKNLISVKGVLSWFPPKDDCEICKGERGGVKGNENIIGGKVVCDYCSTDTLKEKLEKGKE